MVAALATLALAGAGWTSLAGSSSAAAVEGPEGLRLELKDGAVADVRPPVVVVTGGFTLFWKDLEVQAERLRYDDTLQQAWLSGNVRARRPGETLTGETLHLDLPSGNAVVGQAAATVETDGVEGPIFLQSARLEGREDRIEAEGATLTTCPLPMEHAHYRVTVSSLVVRPRQEVAAYHAVFWESGVPIFYWPYLHFSLVNPRAGRFVPPEVGYGQREGWFVRARLPYMGPGSTYGYVLASYFERLGAGLGLYQALYDDGRSFAAVFGETTLREHGGFPPDVRAGTEGQLVAGGGSLTSRNEVARQDLDGRLQYLGWWTASGSLPDWGVRLSLLASGRRPVQEPEELTGASVGSLEVAPPAGGPVSGRLHARWDLARLPDQPARSLWDAVGTLAWKSGDGQIELSAGRISHPDLYADPERKTAWESLVTLPELRASRTVTRWAGALPGQIELRAGAGHFTERRLVDGSAQQTSAWRLTLEPAISLRPVRHGPWELKADSSLWGARYDNGSGQLALKASGSARYYLTPGTYASAGYRLTDPLRVIAGPGEGGERAVPPFQFDQASYEEAIDLGFAAGVGGPLSLSLTSTYDVATGAWKEVTASTRAKAGEVGVGWTAVYDAGQGDLESVTGQLEWAPRQGRVQVAARYAPALQAVDQMAASVSWQVPGQLTLKLGTLYAPVESRVQRADLQLSWRVLPEWVVSAGGSWDTKLGGWVSSEVGVALDQDCRAIGLRYDPSAQRWALGYQIKAFEGAGVAVGAIRPDSLTEESQWQQLLNALEKPPGN
ncbi:MAG: LPS-assembly protein LptD [Limnochordaceae bacterium]|nr:LPS-assembly protein LptD [Limnochordaceae bacterium]